MFKKFNRAIFIGLSAAIFLGGCATSGGGLQQQGQDPQRQQIQSGSGVVTQETSQRDGSEIVNLTPGRMVADGPNNLSNTRLGALWTGATPDHVAIILMNPNLGGAMQVVDITVDGSGTRWTPKVLTGPEAGNPDQPRASAVIVPYSFVQRMSKSQNVRVRVEGPRGYEEAIFSIPRASNGSPTSATSFYEFIAKVDGARRARR